MKFSLSKSCMFLFAVATLVGCENADESAVEPELATTQIYLNGKIYTVDADNSWAEAMAISAGKILAIGSNDEVQALANSDAEVIDLGGKMVMPGIQDSHMHPLDAGIGSQIECRFLTNTLSKALEVLEGCLAELSEDQWLRGGQWNDGLFAGTDKMPKTILDEIAPDTPVFLMDWSVHNAWVNTKALEVFGIDETTQAPEGGKILRNPDTGEATGILLDNAAYKYQRALPEYSLEERMQALSWSVGQMSSYGITTFRDAITTTSHIEAYKGLVDRGQMPIRVKTNLSWKSEWAKSHEQEKELIANRADYASDRLDVGFAKIMLDGIPPTYTAALLEPYEPSEAFGDNYYGKLMHTPEDLAKDVAELDRQRIQVKIHATGDRSLRIALDAIEAARKENGDSGLIHEVSHAEMVHPDDLPRFKELNAAAEMCPILWYPVPGLDWRDIVGVERSKVWPIRSLSESGALVFYGSDWPVVPTANPWPGIEAMITRSNPALEKIEPDWPEQSVNLETAIRIFTINGAIANRAGDSSGSLEAGKDADFIVLNQNIFDVDVKALSDTQILKTVVAGQVVYQSE